MIKPPELETEEGRDVWEAMRAAAAGDVPALRRLIERDARLVLGGNDFPPPIHFAVREGHVDAVGVLLEAGARAARSFNGDALLAVARDRGYDALITLLAGARDAPSRVALGSPFSVLTPECAAASWRCRRGWPPCRHRSGTRRSG